MLRYSLVALGVALAGAPSFGQGVPMDMYPVVGPLRRVELRLDSSGTVRRLDSFTESGVGAVVYDNTCQSNYFVGMLSTSQTGGSESWALGDWGGLPNTSFPATPTCTVGCADAYDITGFEIAYCTSTGNPVDAVLHFWQPPATHCFNPIGGTSPPSTSTTFSTTITGLPRRSVPGTPVACYVVAIDLGTDSFRLDGGAFLPIIPSAETDRFTWSIQLPGTTGLDGPVFAGNPLGACTICGGTVFEFAKGSSSSGHGPGNDNFLFREDYGGTTGGSSCPSITFPPWGGFHLKLFADEPCPPPVSTPFCDDSDGSLSACPCSNPGAPDSGCDIAQSTGGVTLSVLDQQTSPINRATLRGTGFPAMTSPTVIAIRSSSLDPFAPIPFGDGVRCVADSPLVRLAASFAGGGVSTHVFGHNSTMAGLGEFYYQLWYRNMPSTFCDPGAAFNLSNGGTLTWP